MRQKFRTALNQPMAVVVLCPPTWLLLGLCRFAILIIPLRWLSRLYGTDAPLDCQPVDIQDRLLVRASQVKRAISITTKYTPWQSSCYPQALATHLLLCSFHVPHVIYFGMRRTSSRSGDYAAHAWVMAGDVAVSGGRNEGKYTIVRAFAN